MFVVGHSIAVAMIAKAVAFACFRMVPDFDCQKPPKLTGLVEVDCWIMKGTH